ncbi:MAG: preprotein translocase subunit SecG [Chloroflexi bacterium]|nr:preprotein translocase subunit SecG [Chloroflexota bacterium]
MVIEDALKFVQIIISVGLVTLIILQARGTGLGSLFGGAGGGAIQKTRRGLEKTLFQMTVGLSIAFILNAILQLLIQ